MADLMIMNPPVFTEKVHKTEREEFITAELENEIKGALLNNEVFLKVLAETIQKTVKEHIENGIIHVTSQDKTFWSEKASTAVATQKANGLQSAADKKKLDQIASGAEVNQNAFSNVKVGSTIISANGKTATFTLEAGSNVTISADNGTKKIVISANKDGGNADMLDGYHATHFAVADHGHDGRYYTESEVNTLLNGKAASSHNHDARYYTEAEVNTLLNGKAASSHNHDTRYYTETEIDGFLNLKANCNSPQFTGSPKLASGSTAYQTTAMFRNIYFSTSIPSSLEAGTICFVYS